MAQELATVGIVAYTAIPAAIYGTPSPAIVVPVGTLLCLRLALARFGPAQTLGVIDLSDWESVCCSVCVHSLEDRALVLSSPAVRPRCLVP